MREVPARLFCSDTTARLSSIHSSSVIPGQVASSKAPPRNRTVFYRPPSLSGTARTSATCGATRTASSSKPPCSPWLSLYRVPALAAPVKSPPFPL